MKKMFFAGLLAIAVIFTAYSQTGVIRELTGEVEIKPAGASAFVPAQSGAQVAQDTIISTGFRSTAIVVVGVTTITVRPLTRLSLAEISSTAGTENLNVNLQAGRVRVDVKPPAGTKANTTVQSPSATASVRGTVLDMDAYNLEVIEGKVLFKGSDGILVSVLGGTKSTVSSEGSAQNPIDLAKDNLMPSGPVGKGAAGETTGGASDAPVIGDIGLDINW